MTLRCLYPPASNSHHYYFFWIFISSFQGSCTYVSPKVLSCNVYVKLMEATSSEGREGLAVINTETIDGSQVTT